VHNKGDGRVVYNALMRSHAPRIFRLSAVVQHE
jgi:hypothetical protein